MTTGLYVGRFQPFHLGHLDAIRHILGQLDDLVIVVGSAQHSHTLENPFTAGERITMIRLALQEANISLEKYVIVPLPDWDIHKVWVAHLLSQTPAFQVAYTNEPLTGRLLKEAGIKVEHIPFYHRDKFTATEVRRRLLAGENWEELVPKSVAEYLRQIGGDERIREISPNEKLSQSGNLRSSTSVNPKFSAAPSPL